MIRSLSCKKKTTVNGASFAMIYIKKKCTKNKEGAKEIYLPLIGALEEAKEQENVLSS